MSFKNKGLVHLAQARSSMANRLPILNPCLSPIPTPTQLEADLWQHNGVDFTAATIRSNFRHSIVTRYSQNCLLQKYATYGRMHPISPAVPGKPKDQMGERKRFCNCFSAGEAE
jgi:hypothetical protein